jgi:hypothetical protein
MAPPSVNIPGLAEVQRNEVPNDFIDEFIFHQLDWQGNRRHLTAIQELQVTSCDQAVAKWLVIKGFANGS